MASLTKRLKLLTRPVCVRRSYDLFGRMALWFLYLVCIGYFILAGLLYFRLSDSPLAQMTSLYSLTVSHKFFKAIGVVHFAVAALFTMCLVVSVQLKQATTSLVFPQLSSIVPLQSFQLTSAVAARTYSAVSTFTSAAKNTRTYRFISSGYSKVLTPMGMLGVEGRYFDTAFLVREILETALQTNQAYQMSRLLPRPGLNRLYVGLLVISCWSTPLVHRFCGHNLPLQRLLCLLCDTVLDLVSAIGVPVWLALGYLHEYDPGTEDFPLALWYDDKWLVRLMNEAPLILIGSWIGALSKLILSLSLLWTLDDVLHLTKSKPLATLAQLKNGPSTRLIPVAFRRRILSTTVFHLIFFLFGFAILSVQLYAELRPDPTACVLVVRPWLVKEPSCALVEINCLVNPEYTGNRTNFDAITGLLDQVSLEHIVVRHCPRVEFTSRLQLFHNLVGLKTYNSSITSWNEDAAITQSHHQHIRFGFFVRTNFPNATIPAGLLSHDFPQTLRDIEISGSNIDSLPEDLHERWPQMSVLLIEFSELSEFPLVSTKFPGLKTLSLVGNRFTDMPARLFSALPSGCVGLSANPISILPESVTDTPQQILSFLFLVATNISSLPLWMDEAFFEHVLMFLGGTPFCRDVLGDANLPTRSELLASRPYIVEKVDCTEYDPGFYPQALEVRGSEST